MKCSPKVLAACAAALVATAAVTAEPACCGTRTPYPVPVGSIALEEVPPGFRIVHSQLVARHGARGLSKPGPDVALHALWRRAEREGALTALGRGLGPDLLAFIKANRFLGDGVPGVEKPGYGNLTAVGFEDHRGLARRMVARNLSLFEAIAASGRAGAVTLAMSGVDRAEQSARAFTDTLGERVPGIGAALAPANPAVNRFTLYFHKLDARTDRIDGGDDTRHATLRASAAYQAYLRSDGLRERLHVRHGPSREQVEAARALAERLFAPAFIAALSERGLPMVAEQDIDVTSPRTGRAERLRVDGRQGIRDVVELARTLVELDTYARLLRVELGKDFGAYLDPTTVRLFERGDEAATFFEKGPASTDVAPVTYAMAGSLLEDFFASAERALGQPDGAAVTLRFTHAEAILPFVSLLGIPPLFAPVRPGEAFDPAHNAWRAGLVAPMAGNVQWDTWRDADGHAVVRMLLNEREVDFKPACDAARWRPGSRFYDFARLRACYRAAPLPELPRAG